MFLLTSLQVQVPAAPVGDVPLPNPETGTDYAVAPSTERTIVPSIEPEHSVPWDPLGTESQETDQLRESTLSPDEAVTGSSLALFRGQ